jgi:hypothetical protein
MTDPQGAQALAARLKMVGTGSYESDAAAILGPHGLFVPDVRELRARIEGLRWSTMSENRGMTGQYIDRAAVLALFPGGSDDDAG